MSQMSSKKANIFKLWSRVFLISLLLVFILRLFVVESYTVSSSQMETSLLKGDRVLVNKISYGLRMPITLLSIPFTFDSFFGFKSYSDLLQLGYHRLFPSKVGLNDIALFNNPMELDKPLDKRSLYLSRCVATPGDTIKIEGENYYINGNKYIFSPDVVLPFRFNSNNVSTLARLMDTLKIPKRNIVPDSLSAYLPLSRYESFLLSQNLPDSLKLVLDIESLPSYEIVVPSEGQTVEIDSSNVFLYFPIMRSENKENLELKDFEIMQNGEVLRNYTFKNNYYWFLSDNIVDATDSRILGFIPEQNIIGKAFYIWWRSDRSQSPFSSVE